jgi:hypothetical protein
MARWILLESWAKLVYGEDAPSVHTLRRWAREKRLWPEAELQGRSYYVDPEAVYRDPRRPVERVSEIRGALARKLLLEAGRG